MPPSEAQAAEEARQKARDAASPMSSLPEVITQQESFKRGENLARQAGGCPPEMYGEFGNGEVAGRMK